MNSECAFWVVFITAPLGIVFIVVSVFFLWGVLRKRTKAWLKCVFWVVMLIATPLGMVFIGELLNLPEIYETAWEFTIVIVVTLIMGMVVHSVIRVVDCE